MPQTSKIAAVCLATVLVSSLISYAVSAAAPQSLLVSGSTRYAFVQATGPVSTTSSTFSDVNGLSTSINVPAGKTADIIVLWCGMVSTNSYLLVRGMIAGTAGTPAYMQAAKDLAGGAQTHCATFYRGGVAAGTRYVKVQWAAHASFDGTLQSMWNRSMFVILNIH